MAISAPGNRRLIGNAPESAFREPVPLTERGFDSFGRSAEHGFTLIELMVVMLVIALAATAAVLAMPDLHGRVIDEAARFALRVRAARDGAIVDARLVSVWVTPGGYGFDRWESGRWVAMDEKPLTVATKFGPMWGYRWARQYDVKVNGSAEKEPPEWVVQYGR